MANSLADIWIRKQDIKLSKLHKCNYASSVGYLWWGQISVSNKGQLWLHIILVPLTWAVLSLSVNVDQRGACGDPALYLPGKSLSSSWNKGKVTFISSVLYFLGEQLNTSACWHTQKWIDLSFGWNSKNDQCLLLSLLRKLGTGATCHPQALSFALGLVCEPVI